MNRRHNHQYSITVQASDGSLTASQSFTIAVNNVAPSTPTDSNENTNTVAEGAAVGTLVGITASSTDPNGPAVSYSITADSSSGGFKIDSATGVVSVADGSKIDYESAPNHQYSITVQASDGSLTASQSFTIAVTNVAPSTPTDSNENANTIAEGAAVGALVGITALSTDSHGSAVSYSITSDSSGGGFKIDSGTGVVSVADGSKIDYESAVNHQYTITVQASDGSLTASQTFTIAVSNVAPTTPTDTDTYANSVVEGAANGTPVGISASATDANGPAVTYSLTDDAGGRFAIDATTGVITVADGTLLNAAVATQSVTVQASDGAGGVSTATFTITITDAKLSAGALTPPIATTGKAFSNVNVFVFRDANPSSTASDFSAVVTLGDGNTATLTGTATSFGQIVADAGGGFEVQLSYTYSQVLSGKTFSVVVTDAGGASIGASTNSFVVWDVPATGTTFAPGETGTVAGPDSTVSADVTHAGTGDQATTVALVHYQSDPAGGRRIGRGSGGGTQSY